MSCSLNKTQASLRKNNITNQYNELIDSSGKTVSRFNSYLAYIKNLAITKYGQIPQGITNPFYLEGKKVKFNNNFFDWVDRNNTQGVIKETPKFNTNKNDSDLRELYRITEEEREYISIIQGTDKSNSQYILPSLPPKNTLPPINTPREGLPSEQRINYSDLRTIWGRRKEYNINNGKTNEFKQILGTGIATRIFKGGGLIGRMQNALRERGLEYYTFVETNENNFGGLYVTGNRLVINVTDDLIESLDELDYENLVNMLEVILNEEFIHLIAQNIVSDEQIELIKNELTDKDYEKIIEYYTKGNLKTEKEFNKEYPELGRYTLAHEYLRIIVQGKVFNRTSEAEVAKRFSLSNEIKSIFSNLFDYIFSLFESETATPQAKIAVKKIIDFINQEDIPLTENTINIISASFPNSIKETDEQRVVSINNEVDKLVAEIQTAEENIIVKNVEEYFDVINRHLKNLIERKNYERLKKIFTTEEGVNRLSTLQDILKEANKALNDMEGFKRKTRSLALSVVQIDKLTDLMTQDVKELIKNKDNSVENLKTLQSYLNLTNDWSILLDTADESFAIGNPATTKKIGEVKQKLRQLDNLIARNDESGVVKTLQKILIPASEDFLKAINSQLSNEKTKLDRQISRKAKEEDLAKTRNNIKALENKIQEIDFEDAQNVLDFLKGKRGDATFFNTWLESFRDSTDPTISAFATFIKEQVDAVGNRVRKIEFQYEKELSPLVKDSERRNPASLSKKITFEDKIVGKDNTVESVITMLNPWQNYRADYQLLLNSEKEAKDKYQASNIQEDRETYLAAKKSRTNFEVDTLYTEYLPEVYEKNKLWEDEIGQELKEETDNIFSQIAQIDEANRLFDEDLDENQINEKEALLVEYKMLGNLNNPDGSPKTGREFAKAKRMQEIRAFNRKYYEWKDNNTAFEKAKQRHSEFIISEGTVENSPEYNTEMLKWEQENTRILIKDSFYKKREAIAKEINFITKKFKDIKLEENVKELWDEIQSLTYGLRDEDGQPMGTLVQERGAERIKIAQESLEELQDKITKSSGLTGIEQARLSELYSKAKAKNITLDERNELDDLIAKQKLNGLSTSDKKRLGELFEELKELQSNIPTDYYQQTFNNISTQYGVTLLEGGDIIEEYPEGTRVVPVLESKALGNLLKNKDFKDWFDLNHYEVERFNSENNNYEKKWKRTYQWSRIIPNDEQYIDIKPAQKYSYREIKPQYKTERVEGKTIDNKGNWLPNPNKQGSNKYRNEKYFNLVNGKDDESKKLSKILDIHKKYLLSAQTDLTRQNRLYLDVPKVSKERYERNLDFLDKAKKDPTQIPALMWQRITEKYRDLTNFDEQDSRYEPAFDGKYEKDAISIPMKYVGSMDATTVSLDLFRNISKYTYSSELNKQLLETLPVARAINRVVESTDKDKAPSKKNSNRSNAIRRLLLRDYGGQKSNLDLKKIGAAEKPVLALINVSKYLASWATVRINLPAAIANVVNAVTQNIINSGNSIYTAKSYAKSEGIYATRFVPNWQKNYFENKLGQRSLESQLIEAWEPVQGVTLESQIGEKSSQSRLYDTISLNPIFNLREWGEFYVQSRTWISALYETKVEQKTESGIKVISLLDAYEKDEKGFIRLKEGIDKSWDIDKEKFNRLKYKVQNLNRRIHGNYSAYDKTQLEMFALGSLAMFLKRFFYSMFINRFGAEGTLGEYATLKGQDRFNVNFGNERGFYYQTAQVLHRQLKNGLKDWDLLSTQDKQALAKTALEIGAILGAYSLMILMGYSGDDRNKKEKLKNYSWFELNVLYQIDRLFIETSGFIRPGNYGGYLADFQLFTALGKWYKLLQDIISQDEYQKGLKAADGSYVYKAGDKKWKMQAKRATGIQQMLLTKETPDILLVNYDKAIRGR